MAFSRAIAVFITLIFASGTLYFGHRLLSAAPPGAPRNAPPDISTARGSMPSLEYVRNWARKAVGHVNSPDVVMRSSFSRNSAVEVAPAHSPPPLAQKTEASVGVAVDHHQSQPNKKEATGVEWPLPLNSPRVPWLPQVTGARSGNLTVDGHQFWWEVIHDAKPRAMRIHGIITADEAAALREAAAPHIARSQVIDLANNGKSKVDPWRTSNGMFMQTPEQTQHPSVVKLRKRAAAVVGLQEAWIEMMQILRYNAGEYYKAHGDYFAETDSANLNRGGQRIVTLLTWLNNVETGGATRFPMANIEAAPKLGDAVTFYDTDEQSVVDPYSSHEAVPPGSGSTKWVAVLWCHPRPFF